MSMDIASLANNLGFLALVSYIVTLLPTILKIVFPQTKATGLPQLLLKHRRLIGILAFFCLGHGFLMVKKRNFDAFDPKTYLIYFQGTITLIIFTLLAITSNNWSVKKLKKNWKKLHQLTYLATFLLTWHIWDKMSGHWTYLTPVGIVGSTTIIILLLIRLWIEYQEQPQKTKEKISQTKLPANTIR